MNITPTAPYKTYGLFYFVGGSVDAISASDVVSEITDESVTGIVPVVDVERRFLLGR